MILHELADYIEASDLPPIVKFISSEPASKHVEHKFENEDTHQSEWYCGCIVGYDPFTKFFEIAYDSEEDICNFDIILDLILVIAF